MASPVLDLVTARRWAVTARLMLAGAREHIDALNVFPVADGDTGTNMHLTMDGALDYVRGQFELGAGTDRLQEGLALIARGMLLSARGNSGIILAQLTRGLAEAVGPEVEAAGPEEIAVAFETAARTAYDALAAPVEGTILTVARSAAHGARAAVQRGRPAAGAGTLEVGHVVTEALGAAREALARTPEQLPELGAAGVVDAGGAGLVLVIEALESVLQERPPGAGQDLPDWWVLPRPDGAAGGCGLPGAGRGGAGGPGQDQGAGAQGRRADGAGHDEGSGAQGGSDEVEVMYLLGGSDPERAGRLRGLLGQIGGSVVVAGGPHDYSVHVHLEDPRAAVEAGSLAGLVTQVRVTSLDDGRELTVGDTDATGAPQGAGAAGAGPVPGLSVVACALGEGVRELFTAAGASVVSSGPRQRASAGQLLAAVRLCGTDRVVLLPNDGDTVMVARAAADEAAATAPGLTVDVVPTRSLVEGLAALAVLDPDGDADEVLAAMADAAGQVRGGALTRAERPAETPVGPCAAGQWLGIVDQGIVAVDDELAPVAGAVVDHLWHTDAGLVTVLLGADADAATAAVVDRALAAAAGGAPHTPEVVTVEGGQPTYPVLLGVE